MALPWDIQKQKQESPTDADKPARRGSMQKLFQFDVFRFISPNSISLKFQITGAWRHAIGLRPI